MFVKIKYNGGNLYMCNINGNPVNGPTPSGEYDGYLFNGGQAIILTPDGFLALYDKTQFTIDESISLSNGLTKKDKGFTQSSLRAMLGQNVRTLNIEFSEL